MAKYVLHTRKLFLQFLSLIYLFAFCSLYLQIPGLYGERGILPAHTQLPAKNNPIECLLQKKSLICFATYIGLNTSYMMELLALAGSILSFIGFVSTSWNSSILFLVLWSFYLSLYKVGQTFLWFQWDALLLEVGFLAIFVAPLWKNSKQRYHPKDMVTMWLVKWALFRLMFASGVVKLQSGCPTWWGLTALDVHYESQCIPTALAWLMHQFPGWWQKLCVVITLLIEIPIPFFFYSPIRNHRRLAFVLQVFLQLIIMLTGNYNFFNLTTIVMCFSILDDIDLGYKKDNVAHPGLLTSIKRFTSFLLEWIGYGALCYYTFVYFGLHFSPNGLVNSEIGFSKLQFSTWLQYAVQFSICIGSFSLLLTSAEALTCSLFDSRGIMQKLTTFSTTLVYSLLALSMFGVSLVPFSSIDTYTNSKIWPVFKNWHDRTGDFEITSSYGLFRHMTGVGGRPEVILEGSNSLEGPWLEYDFPYKPGKVNLAPQYIIPHQPRVDWQMWFAALGTYSQNPWLISMSYRLLTGEKAVTQLLDNNSPWRETPPTYIRGLKYIYHFTSLTDPNKIDSDWWIRKLEGEYMPVFSVDHRPLVDYLKKGSYIGSKDSELSFKPLVLVLNKIRDLTNFVQPHILIWSLFVAALIIIFTKEKNRYY